MFRDGGSKVPSGQAPTRGTIPLHFVFQGGGAKLGALIAVADEIFEQARPLGYHVASVSGTSAGAIAACMLATGKSPALFRAKIRAIAPGFLPQIVTNHTMVRQFWRAYRGKPLYNANAYASFLGTLFETACLPDRFFRISDLNNDIDLFVHAVDIRTRGSMIYSNRETPTIAIADALIESSGIPFVFNTYSDRRNIIDGGLIDNFPSDTVMAHIAQMADPGYVVGISFERDRTEWTFSDVLAYAKGLISTAIDFPVQRSIQKLDSEDIHLIETTTSTFDFQKALDEDLADDRYGEYRAKAKDFLRNLTRRKALRRATIQPDIIFDRLKSWHEYHLKKQKLNVKKVTLKIVCHCLKLSNSEEVRAAQLYDEFDLITEIEVDARSPVLTTGLGLIMDSRFTDIGEVNVTVRGPDGRGVDAIVFPLTPKMAGDNIERNNLIIFFKEPLNQTGIYRLELRSRLQEVLFNLKTEERKDDIVYANINHELVENVDIVVYIPAEMKLPILESLPSADERIRDSKLKAGERMERNDLEGYGPPPPGYQAFGWKVAGLKRLEGTGFRAHARG